MFKPCFNYAKTSNSARPESFTTPAPPLVQTARHIRRWSNGRRWTSSEECCRSTLWGPAFPSLMEVSPWLKRCSISNKNTLYVYIYIYINIEWDYWHTQSIVINAVVCIYDILNSRNTLGTIILNYIYLAEASSRNIYYIKCFVMSNNWKQCVYIYMQLISMF